VRNLKDKEKTLQERTGNTIGVKIQPNRKDTCFGKNRSAPITTNRKKGERKLRKNEDTPQKSLKREKKTSPLNGKGTSNITITPKRSTGTLKKSLREVKGPEKLQEKTPKKF